MWCVHIQPGAEGCVARLGYTMTWWESSRGASCKVVRCTKVSNRWGSDCCPASRSRSTGFCNWAIKCCSRASPRATGFAWPCPDHRPVTQKSGGPASTSPAEGRSPWLLVRRWQNDVRRTGPARLSGRGLVRRHRPQRHGRCQGQTGARWRRGGIQRRRSQGNHGQAGQHHQH